MTNPQDEIIRFLSAADAYGVGGPVERIDTHAAIIFLAGDRAYKLKRAVTYPYLDYITVELRRAACEAELALNRRTAPRLYLEVRPVRRTPEGELSLQRQGEPADWLVVMRRFAQEELFDRLADRGALTPRLLGDLTDHIVAFHAEAEIMPGRGGAGAARRIIAGNRESMERYPGLLPPDDVAALHRESLAELGRVAALLDRRAAEGHVRRCHGDLHLRNICLFEGAPTLFDCIEFSEELACTDVLHDLAFLLMDLWQRGLRREAGMVFNRYLDRADEGGGLPALPLYLSLRAAVRAHVAGAAATVDSDSEDRMCQQQAASAYLAAARRFLIRPDPRLVAIGGFSGTGKSTLAQALAPQLAAPPGARILRSDIMRKRLFGERPDARLPPSAYRRHVSRTVYKRLCSDARAALADGCTVIVDAVFADPRERAAIEAAAAGFPFAGLWLEAPAAQLEPRLMARRDDASDATVAVLRRQLTYDIGDLGRWQAVDAGGGPEAVARAASALIIAPRAAQGPASRTPSTA